MTLAVNPRQTDDLPTEPYRTSSYELPTNPTRNARWMRCEYGDSMMEWLWRGTCAHCENHMFEEMESEGLSVDDYVSLHRQYHGPFVDVENPERSWPVCKRCHARNGTAMLPGLRSSYPEGLLPVEWPDSVLKSIAERGKAEAEANAVWLVDMPVVPQRGAFMFNPATAVLDRFVEWASKSTIRLEEAGVAQAKDWMACTSAMYGVPHQNIIAMPNSGDDPGPYVALRWSQRGVAVRRSSGGTVTFALDIVAIAVPMVNPEFETAAAKTKRLEFEVARLKEGFQRRMVVEGQARDWCSTFDPMLDSQGLRPRKKKTRVVGTLKFDTELGRELSEQDIVKIRTGTGWSNYLSTSAFVIDTFEVAAEDEARMLS